MGQITNEVTGMLNTLAAAGYLGQNMNKELNASYDETHNEYSKELEKQQENASNYIKEAKDTIKQLEGIEGTENTIEDIRKDIDKEKSNIILREILRPEKDELSFKNQGLFAKQRQVENLKRNLNELHKYRTDYDSRKEGLSNVLDDYMNEHNALMEARARAEDNLKANTESISSTRKKFNNHMAALRQRNSGGIR